MRHQRFLIAYAASVSAALPVALWLLGGPGILVVAISAILVLAAHLDNHTGSCLLITVVLLVVIGILLSLLMLVARSGVR